MIHQTKLHLLGSLFLGIALWPLGVRDVHAEPFCVEQTGIPAQCIYVDPGECQKEATRLGGSCSAKPELLSQAATSAKFCVVNSSMVPLCLFADRNSCNVDARRRAGACVEALPAPNEPAALDPYRLKRNE